MLIQWLNATNTKGENVAYDKATMRVIEVIQDLNCPILISSEHVLWSRVDENATML